MIVWLLSVSRQTFGPSGLASLSLLRKPHRKTALVLVSLLWYVAMLKIVYKPTDHGITTFCQENFMVYSKVYSMYSLSTMRTILFQSTCRN